MKDIKNVSEETITEINSYIKDLKFYFKTCKNSSKAVILRNIKDAEEHKKRYLTRLEQQKINAG